MAIDKIQASERIREATSDHIERGSLAESVNKLFEKSSDLLQLPLNLFLQPFAASFNIKLFSNISSYAFSPTSSNTKFLIFEMFALNNDKKEAFEHRKEERKKEFLHLRSLWIEDYDNERLEIKREFHLV